MKIGPLQPTTSFGLDPAAKAEEAKAKVESGQVGAKNAIDPEKLRLAREFEQIFIRKMLSSLEKSGQGENGKAAAGGSAYGSMVVSALAEAVSKGGGVGLAEVIARAASQPVDAGSISSTPSKASLEAAIATATGHSTTAAGISLPSGSIGITVPQGVRIDVQGTPNATTYTRPTPPTIVNENSKIQESLKGPSR
jgi:Rod binding domain-containing protein